MMTGEDQTLYWVATFHPQDVQEPSWSPEAHPKDVVVFVGLTRAQVDRLTGYFTPGVYHAPYHWVFGRMDGSDAVGAPPYMKLEKWLAAEAVAQTVP